MTSARDDSENLDRERERLVSEAFDLTVEQAQVEPKVPKTFAWRGPMLGLLLLAQAGVVAWNVYLARLPVEIAPRERIEESLGSSIYMAAFAISAYVDETGSLPKSLRDVGMDESGIEFRLVGEGYELLTEYEGVSVLYRSGEDLTPFAAAGGFPDPGDPR